MGVALARVVERRNPFSFLLEGGGCRIEGRRPRGSAGYGWENSIGMHLK
jgi:hypothetical protein